MTAAREDTLSRQIERGEVFAGSSGSTVDNSDADEYLIITGAEEVSFRVGWNVPDNSLFTLIIGEGTTVSSNGSAITDINMKRSDTTTTMNAVVYSGPTVTGIGTPIYTQNIYGSAVPDVGVYNSGSGLILKASTNYLFQFTNNGNGQVSTNMTFFLRDIT